MLQSEQTSESTHDDAPLFICARFLATWLLSGTILGVIFGFWIGGSIGLLIAIGYIKAVHWTEVLATLAPGSPRRPRRRDSAAIEQ